MNENTKKWETTGLLDITPDDMKDHVANDLEELTKLLLQKYGTSDGVLKDRGEKDRSEFVCGIILPAMVRIYNENIICFHRPMAAELFGDLEKYVDEHGIVSSTLCRQCEASDDEAVYLDTYLKHFKESK